MNKQLLKNIAIYLGIVLLFLGISYAYAPQLLSGKIINQSDISGWSGMSQESYDWTGQHPDDPARWTDSMFGGMPNVTFYEFFKGDWTAPLYNALFIGTRPASYLFLALLGAFLMMLSLGIRRSLALVGAFAVAFCSYNFQIMQVGHNTKMQAIAFAPWALAALFYTYRSAVKEGKSLKEIIPYTALGAVLFGLALSFQVKANHVQITYYLAIVILIYAIATLIWVLLRKDKGLFTRFACASAFLLIFGLIGIGTNATKLVPTYAYTPHTMRGGSELVKESQGGDGDGLDLDYATSWSYGIEEIPNLLIPNFNGGSSNGSVGKGSATWKLFEDAGMNPRQVCDSLPLYWGPQPFTAGPMYMGAITIFLFILGLCVLKGRDKWWAVVCVVLSVFLAWGNHMMWFTELWFKYAPMYNKFRTVSMALVVLQFLLPLVGIYALDRILRNDIPQKKLINSIWISLGITGGFCAVCALLPGIAGDFVAASDGQMQDVIAAALQEDRASLLKSDAFRSLVFILLTAAVLLYYSYRGSKATSRQVSASIVIIGLLMVVDLWSVDKRYLNDGDFVTRKEFKSAMAERPVDEYILVDKSPSYRVLDLTESPFNSSLTSARHKSIGGYSPTKMQRYQDLIDRYLASEINSYISAMSGCTTFEEVQNAVTYMPVLSMLNGKYFIVGEQLPPVTNPYAFGAAWFVDSLMGVTSAEDEINALGQLDLHTTAVIRSDRTAAAVAPSDGQKAVNIISYSPNELHYAYTCQEPGAVVFSEIYHPSWKAKVIYEDATGVAKEEPLELFQADWVLRGAVLPAGTGEVVMRYEPQDYVVGETISRICCTLLLIVSLCSVGFFIWTNRKK